MLATVDTLRALRERYGLTQAQVAAQAGVKQPEVSAVENGVRCTPEARQRILTAIRELARPQIGLTPDVRAKALAVFAKFGGTDVRIFGSVAQGTDKPGSDVDFVARFPAGFSLFDLMALEEELEELIGIPVDVVSDDPRGGHALAEINRSAVPLAVSA
jgi:predicted nucleotidyltransferase/DNA-binding XRE family transcriptional regulator